METERIKSPRDIRNLMAELWVEHTLGFTSPKARVYMVDLPEPTEEEKRIMAQNRENRKPAMIDEDALKESLQKAAGKLGGW